jgi:hypothetical protein
VAYVPDDFVGRGIELVQQRYGELDHPEAGADVAAGDRAALDEPVPNLLGQLGELVAAQTLEVLGRLDAREQGHGR